MKKVTSFIIILISFIVFGGIIFENNILDIFINNKLQQKTTYNTLEEISKIMINKGNNNITSFSNNNTVKVIKETKTENNNLPLIYIYNTHDKEEYVNPDKSIYNIDCNVRTAAYILQDKLKLYGINAIVEERSPTSEVNKRKEDYPMTYEYSRSYLKETKEKYPSVKYFIDLHRDGVSKEVSTAVINDKSYAKLMFFLGLAHEESDKNKQLVKSLEAIINKKYEGLLRNTFIRYDDSYNQDLSPNSFLIEVGGNKNTIDEVYNSISVLAEALATYIGEQDGKNS